MRKATAHSKESPSTYLVPSHSPEEIERLTVQDRMLTLGIGGLLPDMEDPTQLHHVLDVGCGVGSWLMETAKDYPTIERLVGVDISARAITYARDWAESLGLDGRVQFQVMDALQALEFSPASFDLVNQRAGLSWLRTWDWPKVLMEYQRVTRPGGIIRITEPSLVMDSNSEALMQLNTVLLEAFHHSGHFFTADTAGVVYELEGLMVRHGIKNVQTRVYKSPFCEPDTEYGRCFYEDMVHVYRVALPFLQKWARVPRNYQEIYHQALREMKQPDFRASGVIITAWGINNYRRHP